MERVTWSLQQRPQHDQQHARRTVATRSQFPLDLAWATTIHKSQGMSLDVVHVDLTNTLVQDGMAYVALSQCRSLQGLTVTGLTQKSIRVHREALSFHESLARRREAESSLKRRKVDKSEDEQ
jgi:ATP-dependent DNA helicase PIF1